MIGAGKYDDDLTAVRMKLHATGAVLIVFDGPHGPGFSVQAPLPLLVGLPIVLRELANAVERDVQRMTPDA